MKLRRSVASHEPVNRLCVTLPVIAHLVCPESRAVKAYYKETFLLILGRNTRILRTRSNPLCETVRNGQLTPMASVARRSLAPPAVVSTSAFVFAVLLGIRP